MTDQQALAQYTDRRDADAFRHLVNVYAGLVYAAARRRLKSDHDIEDVVQTTFLKLAKSSHDIREDLGSWLYTTALNSATDLVRQDQTRRRHEAIMPPTPEADLSDPHAETLDREEWQRLSPLIDDAILALPPDQRTLVIQHFFQNRSHRELASELHVSHASIQRRLSAAIESLRATLRASGCLPNAPALIGALHALSKTSIPAPLSSQLIKIGLAGTGSHFAKASKTLQIATKSKAGLATAVASLLALMTITGFLFSNRLPSSSPPALPAAGAAPTAEPVTPVWKISADFTVEGIGVGRDMAVDSKGNVYSAGFIIDPKTQVAHGIIRQKPAGHLDWKTIYDIPNSLFDHLLVDQEDNLFVEGVKIINREPQGQTWVEMLLKRPPTQNEFSAIDISYLPAPAAHLCIDTNGNLYATFLNPDSDVKLHEAVKLARGESRVQPIYPMGAQFGGMGDPLLYGMDAIKTGPLSGLYAVGFYADQEPRHYVVRKSTDGGASWNTISEFQNGPETIRLWHNAMIFGNESALYITSLWEESPSSRAQEHPALLHFITRKSVDGGISWPIDDDLLAPSWFDGRPAQCNLYTYRGNAYFSLIELCEGHVRNFIRTNAGGAWHDIRENIDGLCLGLAGDPNGTLYVNEMPEVYPSDANSHWSIISLSPGPESTSQAKAIPSLNSTTPRSRSP